MTDQHIVEKDRSAIYIGNIFTVEADLTLPVKGKYGSDITWTSSAPHLISEDGQVHRPYAGTGDRPVCLTAFVRYGSQAVVREFQATVLQKSATVKLRRALPMQVTVEKGAHLQLPGVCIAENKDGSKTTIPVEWVLPPNFDLFAEGSYQITAQPFVLQPDILPIAIVTVTDAMPHKSLHQKRLTAFPLTDVSIDGGVFLQNKILMEDYLLSVNDNSMLYNFREAAGLSTQDAPPLLGWDAPQSLLKGHTTGHYLSALAFAFAGGGARQKSFQEKITTMVEGLFACQAAMESSNKFAAGFLSGYSEEQFDLLEDYIPYPSIWAPYYTLHKILAGLLDCYEIAGNKKALEICEKLGLWVYNRLEKCDEEKRQKMWSMYIAGEFGGMNEVMARLNEITSNSKYLLAAEFFCNDKLFVPMSMNVNTLGGMHANQHIPQIIGTMKLFEQTHKNAYYEISKNFWEMVTRNHIYPIGGTGEGEMFHQPDCLAGCLSDKNAETCATYNLLKLTKMIYEYEPSAAMMDYYEKALVNHIVASSDPSGATGGTTYFMPMRFGGIKEYETDSNSCCHGTGMENPLKYQESIYFKDDDSLYVNLYIPSTLHYREKGIKLMQTGDFLYDERATIVIDGSGDLTIKLRLPCWLQAPAVVTINGTATPYGQQDGYAIVKSFFRTGDTIVVTLPFHLYSEAAPDVPTHCALYYGPLVLAAECDSADPIRLPANERLSEDIIKVEGLLEFRYKSITLKPIHLIFGKPYHLYFEQNTDER